VSYSDSCTFLFTEKKKYINSHRKTWEQGDPDDNRQTKEKVTVLSKNDRHPRISGWRFQLKFRSSYWFDSFIPCQYQTTQLRASVCNRQTKPQWSISNNWRTTCSMTLWGNLQMCHRYTSFSMNRSHWKISGYCGECRGICSSGRVLSGIRSVSSSSNPTTTQKHQNCVELKVWLKDFTNTDMEPEPVHPTLQKWT
jgi:hypothetical protein